MMKFVLALVVGIAVGSAYGFNDAQVHEKSIVSRMVERVGGSNREGFKNDIDGRMEKAVR